MVSWREDGYCNGGNLPGAYIVGNTLHYQDLKWYETLKDSELKEEALRNKVILEGLINNEDKSSNNGWRRWDSYDIADHDQEEREYDNKHEDEERCKLFDDHELSVCTIRRFKMIKYLFKQDKEYVGIKEDEYEDLTNTIKEAIHAYQEIFCMMNEGLMGLESVSIRRIQCVGYGVLGFLGVGTTFDIFQNILFPYSLNTAYCLSWIRRIGHVSFVVFGESRHKYAVSSLMDTAY
ncbi:hypothetical protein Tco_1571047 [Tanacetum coccineum]